MNKSSGSPGSGIGPDGGGQDSQSSGMSSYQQILATASVSQAQRRAEGPSAALDRVRGLESSAVA